METILNALRTRTTWEEVAAELGLTADDAQLAVRDYLRSRVPAPSGEVLFPYVNARIVRDSWGVPHVFAGSVPEAYYALGFAMGQDRLWQMDYFRRMAYGTVAEILGEAGLLSDRLARTLNFRRVAEECDARLTGDARDAVDYFTGGINLARVLAARDGLPFEFELLQYEPEAWEPVDVSAVLRAFWWQLTGRFQTICVPEFARRILGEGPLYRALMTPEGGEETVWPRGVPYPEHPRWEHHPGELRATDSGGTGSNNWVVGPSRTATGQPLLCGDPHLPFAIPSIWYEARLKAPGLNACGAFAAGIPGLFYGRNEDTAWAITNNISSLRDLYQEIVEDFDQTRYRRPDGWKGMTTRRETIPVRGAAPVEVEVREVDHGPVVSDLLPAWAQNGEVVSLRWVGHEATPELELMLGWAAAGSVGQFRESLREWACPTFNFVMADRSGAIGYQLTGRLPLRRVPAAGYRPGDEAAHRWLGYVPFEMLPASDEPPEGWLGSANNIVATESWPYPLTGTWPSDYRMQRLVQLWNAPGRFTAEDMARAQSDVHSPRAADWVGPAAAALREAGIAHPLLEEMESWDRAFRIESRPAAVWETFFAAWARACLLERLPVEMLPTVFPLAAGLVERLLPGDEAGWFRTPDARQDALRAAWEAALRTLEARLGPDSGSWRWGAVHTLTLRHPAAGTPVLQDLLDCGPLEHPGTWNTLNNSLYEPDRLFESITGVSYRVLVDFAGEMRAVNSGGQSGHPGSPHYGDQLPLWQTGQYHSLGLSDGVEGPEWRIRPE